MEGFKIRHQETITHSVIKSTDKGEFMVFFLRGFRLEIGDLVRKISRHIGKGNHPITWSPIHA